MFFKLNIQDTILPYIGVVLLMVAVCLGRDVIRYKKVMGKKTKLKNEINTEISDINVKIDDYNKNCIEKERENWSDKIKNFETKRVENFNYPLEFALEKLSTMNKQHDVFYGGKNVNYSLQYYPYPEDYEIKKEEYYKAKNEKQTLEIERQLFD